MPSIPPPFQSTKTFTKLKYAKDRKKPLTFTKIQRAITNNISRLARIEFTKAAARFNGRVRYASQHVMLEAALNIFDKKGWDVSKSTWLAKHWRGICAGLSCEWIEWHARGADMIHWVVLCTTRKFEQGIYDPGSVYPVLFAQENHSVSARCRQFKKVGYVHTSTFTSQYPFTNLTNFRFSPSSYYYIENWSHAMAAYVDEERKVEFYEPDVGVATGLSSVSFLPMYFKNLADVSVNTMVHHPEKFLDAKTMHPKRIDRLREEANSWSYTFWEYKKDKLTSFVMPDQKSKYY